MSLGEGIGSMLAAFTLGEGGSLSSSLSSLEERLMKSKCEDDSTALL